MGSGSIVAAAVLRGRRYVSCKLPAECFVLAERQRMRLEAAPDWIDPGVGRSQ